MTAAEPVNMDALPPGIDSLEVAALRSLRPGTHRLTFPAPPAPCAVLLLVAEDSAGGVSLLIEAKVGQRGSRDTWKPVCSIDGAGLGQHARTFDSREFLEHPGSSYAVLRASLYVVVSSVRCSLTLLSAPDPAAMEAA